MLDKLTHLISLRKQQLAKLDEVVKARFVEMFGDPVQNTKNFPLRMGQDIFKLSSGKHTSNGVIAILSGTGSGYTEESYDPEIIQVPFDNVDTDCLFKQIR